MQAGAAHLLDRNSCDPRAQVLLEAAQCILSDRAAAYGPPEDNFANIAVLWDAYLDMRTGGRAAKISPADQAIMMALMKIARLATNPTHKDSWVDGAGYMGCGYRCAVVAGKGEARVKVAPQDGLDEVERQEAVQYAAASKKKQDAFDAAAYSRKIREQQRERDKGHVWVGGAPDGTTMRY